MDDFVRMDVIYESGDVELLRSDLKTMRSINVHVHDAAR